MRLSLIKLFKIANYLYNLAAVQFRTNADALLKILIIWFLFGSKFGIFFKQNFSKKNNQIVFFEIKYDFLSHLKSIWPDFVWKDNLVMIELVCKKVKVVTFNWVNSYSLHKGPSIIHIDIFLRVLIPSPFMETFSK